MEFVGVPSAVATGLLRGRRLTRAPMRFALVGHWGIGAPVGLYFCERLEQGVVGLWLGLTVGTIVTALLTIRLLFAEGPRSPS